MNEFVVELPNELHAEIIRHAGHGPEREAAWVADAVREKLAACQQRDYLEQCAARGNREQFERVLSKIPAVPPVAGDEK